MKTEWSKEWSSSIKPAKQRKYRFNAPLHVKQKLMHVHLSKELRTKYGVRSVQVRKGDKVQLVRGQYKKKSGNVDRVMLKRGKVFIEGLDTAKKDGTSSAIAFEPSNLIITGLNLDDKRRKKALEERTKKEKK